MEKRELSPDERREMVRTLLEQSGSSDPCTKVARYEEIVSEYGDVPESKFARKYLKDITKKLTVANQKHRQAFHRLEKINPNVGNVLESIRISEEFFESCPVSILGEAAKVEIEYFKAYRLKHYGY